MSSRVKRTYSARNRTTLSSPSPSSPSHPAPTKKRPLLDQLNFPDVPPSKKPRLTKSTPSKSSSNTKSLIQLHFSIDTSILKTCPICDLSYTKGAPDDESLHKAHCTRVQRGMEWGKEQEKEFVKSGVREVTTGIRLKNGTHGRIITFSANVGGKIGAKLAILLDTINLTLSSPALPQSALDASKVYLFLLSPSASASLFREKIVGCVLAQRIETAMAIVSSASSAYSVDKLVPVDASTGLFCDPTPLPTPLGIPRMFVSSSHRRQGIASHLLSAAATTFVHGCLLDPSKGEVAFTQPTGDGKSLIEQWGKGGARIYQE